MVSPDWGRQEPDSHGGDAERAVRGFSLTAAVLVGSFVVACMAQFDVGVVPDGVRARLGAYRVVWPQDWVFFVGNLDGDAVVAYRSKPDGRLARLHEREAWDDRLGGLDRSADNLSFEAWQIARQVPERFWMSCPVRCERMPGLGATFQLRTGSLHPQLCGELVIAIEHTQPSDVERLPDGTWAAYRVADVDVLCTG